MCSYLQSSLTAPLGTGDGQWHNQTWAYTGPGPGNCSGNLAESLREHEVGLRFQRCSVSHIFNELVNAVVQANSIFKASKLPRFARDRDFPSLTHPLKLCGTMCALATATSWLRHCTRVTILHPKPL